MMVKILILNYCFLVDNHHTKNLTESRCGIILSSCRMTLISLHLSISNQIANIILATLPYYVVESLPIVHFVMYPLREIIRHFALQERSMSVG